MRLPYLFNFSASDRGGGLKRLEEYARWFDQRGGANFAIHPGCERLTEQFPANRYFPIRQTVADRLFRDAAYVSDIISETRPLALYYAYGIPIYQRVAKINWFHLSNVMPFNFWRYRLPVLDYIKQPLLARRYRGNIENADVISAESQASLAFLKTGDSRRLHVSVNGSDDELARIAEQQPGRAEPVAVVVGTYSYKAIADSYRVYRHLRSLEPELQLAIIGVDRTVPAHICRDPQVRCTGLLPRCEVVRTLERAAYYISTTRLENSYNAASEGIFLARQSYISAIPPHLELLAGQAYERVVLPGVATPLLRVKREDATPDALRSWDWVIRDMLRRAGLADG